MTTFSLGAPQDRRGNFIWLSNEASLSRFWRGACRRQCRWSPRRLSRTKLLCSATRNGTYGWRAKPVAFRPWRRNFCAVWPNQSGLVVPEDAIGLSRVDLDQDGKPDFVFTINGGYPKIYENRCEQVGHHRSTISDQQLRYDRKSHRTPRDGLMLSGRPAPPVRLTERDQHPLRWLLRWERE